MSARAWERRRLNKRHRIAAKREAELMRQLYRAFLPAAWAARYAPWSNPSHDVMADLRAAWGYGCGPRFVTFDEIDLLEGAVFVEHLADPERPTLAEIQGGTPV